MNFVFEMSAPPIESDQALFYFPSQLVYNTSVDSEGFPFDPNATVTRTTPDPVSVPCGIEFDDGQGGASSAGIINESRIKITVLDESYPSVQNALYVVIAGERYNYRFTEPPSGLFDVGVYVMHFVAENET